MTQSKNIFVYGTLALKDKQRELGLTYKDVIEYDYIKGYKLWEITDNGDVYLQARKEEGIISGSILIDCNLDECLDALDEWEGEQYTREIITTEKNKIECIIYIFNSNNSNKYKKHGDVANEFNESTLSDIKNITIYKKRLNKYWNCSYELFIKNWSNSNKINNI